MNIYFDETQEIFHLQNEEISYLIKIEEGGYLTQLYFGKRIKQIYGHRTYPRVDRSFSPNPAHVETDKFSLDTLLMEYPGAGFGDYRTPAHSLRQPDGTQVTDLRFTGDYWINDGKPSLEGLPATYLENPEEGMTLTIRLVDKLSQVAVDLYYTIFLQGGSLARSAHFINLGSEQVVLEKAASLSIDFPSTNFDLIHLAGAWSKERQIVRETVSQGIKVLNSSRGASSHHQNPFAALVAPDTTEHQGECYGFCLLYSGNHEEIIERDAYGQTRVMIGLNPFDFRWPLDPGAEFQTPEAILTYSDQGLNGLSHNYHNLFGNHLIRGRYKKTERPILINNWEATYFDFNQEKLTKIIDEAADLGIELFVLDDGWFGHREDDRTSLGDWYENPGKLVDGLKGLAHRIHAQGLKFGLWFEPEMISEISDLYREHPDWALQIPGREKSLGRNQYVLDFSREEIRMEIYRQMVAILDEVPIDYIKWDFNRNLTEIYSLNTIPEQQASIAHRYILGLYDFLEKLTSDYPEILFESCSGGGGRFDGGLLYYMPQVWTSDNTDAAARLFIQYGTSLVYPISSMGAHVSDVPNHQVHRTTSFETRGNVAMSGVFGYELDLSRCTAVEKKEMKRQIAFYKKHRSLIQYGCFIRLLSPFEGNDVAWMFVSVDKKEALVFYYRLLADVAYPIVSLKLKGLDPEGLYVIDDKLYGGDELLNVGLLLPPNLKGDFVSKVFHLKVQEEEK